MSKEAKTGLALLREPFLPNQISKLPKPNRRDAIKGKCMPKSKGGDAPDWQDHFCGGYHGLPAVHLDYVGHAALTDRLLDCDPKWAWEPCVKPGLPDPGNGMWIELTVCDVTRIGYGSADGKSGGDAIKEIIGDGLRNAAMRFGAALDLWHKGDLHLDASEEGAPETREGQSQEDAVAPPADPTKGWREPDSAYSTPSKLHKIMMSLDHDLNGCGDSSMVYAITATTEWKEFVRVAGIHCPHYLRGGEPAPDDFEGLIAKAENLVKKFDSDEAQKMAGFATA
ncbi:MAG: hypothetical protein NUV75_00570 [Gallionella sp.]|nr:hypothetical protein [Gallionella sp.]